jgi:hypothetical protein
MISGFCHKIAGNWTLLSYYATSSGKFLPIFLDNLSVLLNIEDGTDRLLEM